MSSHTANPVGPDEQPPSIDLITQVYDMDATIMNAVYDVSCITDVDESQCVAYTLERIEEHLQVLRVVGFRTAAMERLITAFEKLATIMRQAASDGAEFHDLDVK